MFIQQSFRSNDEAGCLYLVPTPIGNLQDMTYRAVDVLKGVNVIAAEDTRHTKKLCHVFSIDTPLISYHEHNKKERENYLVERVKSGEKIALVSDAGMPAISDPGSDLVARFTAEGLSVIALPGANAALTALIASGLSTDEFTFLGFLNRKKKERETTLKRWQASLSTLILYEAPHRLKETLEAVREVLGNRQIALCREITKQYETFVRGRIEEVLSHIEQEGIKGECVIILSGATEEEIEQLQEAPWWESLSIKEHVQAYIDDEEMISKDAIKRTAEDRGLKKRDVYQKYHIN
ncbi:16S rRNA (cytidine(1402)-2'-O)-methyltransferase [Evansella cellulosilytica]|uniref:Ribosomal RNA small subunit methyltransferase I n=1 Tax=Evansella cellulosilytica (strain ATCC 21833 / DSM 2522 / FERM P-1141 / JCM 9156 / N-4) TaxID=649639 RepID=E6TRN4_EVAC2|nr:16S rRNA (cytidine(1402)-2'-O)-methyltransferase [Evansella cellulosilytica]ADU28328.1 Uroporphyrin-III C/tetrapyrrole (Corrin/Porphyrin) methyltransferase [Evansella cellulosilytica DSM 2522]